ELIDDNRVVAPELEQTLTETRRDLLRDATPDGRRTRERDQIDAAIVDERLRERRVRADEELEDARIAVTLEHAIHEPLDRDRAERCLRRRLPYADIAANRGEEGVPRPDRDGKVERADDAYEPERVPLLVHAMLRALGMHREAVQHARLTDREVCDIDHLLYLTVSFGFDLAGFERDERAERVFVAAESFGDQADRFAALRSRHDSPLLERLARGCDDTFVIGGGARAHASKRLAGRRIHRFEDRCLRIVRPAALLRPRARVELVELECCENLAHDPPPSAESRERQKHRRHQSTSLPSIRFISLSRL